MNLSQLIKQIDNIESGAPSFKLYINESVYNTPEMAKHWKKLDEGFFRGYDQYLQEVALTPDQIQNIFKQAGQGGAAASGDAAAGTDAAKDPGKLEKIVSKVLPDSQAANLEKSLPEPDAGPVQGFEQKAAAAVQGIQGADSSTKQSLMQWIKSGVQKPEAQQLILAALSAGVGGLISKAGPILSMIPGGGPVVAAITGAIIAGTVAVAQAKMQGKDWKSAFKGAIKPALMGGASAVIGNLATTAVSAMTSGGSSGDQPQGQSSDSSKLPGASLSVGQELPDGEVISSLDSSNPNASVTITKPDGSTYTVSRDTAHQMTGQQGIGNQWQGGPVSGSASSDPTAGVSDKQPMTLDQINAAKDALRAGNANDMSAPMDAPAGITARPSNLQPLNNLDGSERPGAADANAATDSGATSNQGRLKMNQWRQDVGSPNAVPVTPDTPSDGSYQQSAPIGANGQPMQQVPMDEPASGITPRLPPGASMSDFSNTSDASASQQADWANGNNPPPDWTKNNATGKYEPPSAAAPVDTSQAPQGAAMDPAYLQKVASGEVQRAMISPEKAQAALDWQAQNGGQVQPPKGTWSDGGRNSYPGGLAQYYKDHPGIRESAINKQATLTEWLKADQQGQKINSVQLNTVFVEGIFDFFKGGKKDAAPAAQTEPTMGASVDSLNQAWKAAGSPTDSEEVAKILQGAGVAQDVVAKIYTDLKIPAPGATPAQEPAAQEPAAPAAAADMKAADITKGLQDFWSKATASQGSQTSSPAVQQQLRSMAKQAGMAGQTLESKQTKFYSKFLGKEI